MIKQKSKVDEHPIVALDSSGDEDSGRKEVRRKRIHEMGNNHQVNSTGSKGVVQNGNSTKSYSFPTAIKPPVDHVVNNHVAALHARNTSSGDEIKVEDLNIRFQLEKGQFTPPPPPSNSGLPTVYFNKADNTECLLHKLTSKDTLQGISLKYGVEIPVLKKVNKLWRNDDMFARKDLIIPITMEQFISKSKQYEQEIPSTPKTLNSMKMNELIHKFMDIAKCEEDVAKHYLETKNYNFTKALGFYFSEQDANSKIQKNGKSAPLISFDDLEIWTDEEARKRQLQHFEDMTISAINGPNHLSKVSEQVRSRLNKESEQIFDL